MTYKAWVLMNIDYEFELLKTLEKKYGKISKQYKKKLEQINNLKENLK